MRAVTKLRDEKKTSKTAADEAAKLKLSANKYKKNVGKLKKSVKCKDKNKELSKSAKDLKKAEDNHAATRI